MLSVKDLEELRAFRQTLHQYPELSGEETKTAARVSAKLEEYNPDSLMRNIGGHGVIAIFDSGKPGPSLCIRVDMDALPIEEKGNLPYTSKHPGIAHLCGHDGHTTIGIGLAKLLSKKRPDAGRVIILFQPSEENGMGAQRVLNDPSFLELKIDKVIALHNLPGFPMHQVVVRDGTFACASTGIVLDFEGMTAHAAEPENGISPLGAIQELIDYLAPYRKVKKTERFRLLTVVHLKVGEPAFGISPGKGTLMLTLRAESDDMLSGLKNDITAKALQVAKANQLKLNTGEVEPFSATKNSDGFSDDLRRHAEKIKLEVLHLQDPFRWSEDVGLLTGKYGGGLFGLGAGEETPALHNPTYDFPDSLIESGVQLLNEFIE